jgi:hypothetical protein
MVKVNISKDDFEWGYRIGKNNANEPLAYYGMVGLWAMHVIQGNVITHIYFRRPIGLRNFYKNCKVQESDDPLKWNLECDDDYINKLLSSQNTRAFKEHSLISVK